MLSRLRKSTLFKQLAVLAGGSSLAQLLTLLTAPILTRLYSPAEIGMWSSYTAILLTLASIGALRFDFAIVLAKSSPEARALFRLATKFNLATCALTAVVMLVGAGAIANALNAPHLKILLLTLAPCLFFYTQSLVLHFWFTRQRSFGAITEQRIAQSAGTNSTQVAGGIIAPGAAALVIGTLGGGLLGWLMSERRRRHEVVESETPEIHTTKDLLRRHWRMPVLNGLAAIADGVRLNGTNLLVAVYFSQHVLGFYALAWRCVRLPVSLVAGVVSTVFYERFASCAPGTLTAEVRRCVYYCGLLGIPVFTVLAVAGPAAFEFVFGPDWRIAGQIAQAMTPYLYLNFITSPISTVYLVTNRQGVSIVFALTYLIAPVVAIGWFHESVLEMTHVLSWSMAVLLAVFLVTAIRVSQAHDARSLVQ